MRYLMQYTGRTYRRRTGYGDRGSAAPTLYIELTEAVPMTLFHPAFAGLKCEILEPSRCQSNVSLSPMHRCLQALFCHFCRIHTRAEKCELEETSNRMSLLVTSTALYQHHASPKSRTSFFLVLVSDLVDILDQCTSSKMSNT
jgi:hypothetical protein